MRVVGPGAVPEGEEELFRCEKCRVPTRMSRLKVHGKQGSAKFRCHGCDNVLQKLYRCTGSSVLPWAMDEDAQAKFFIECAQATGDELRVKVEKMKENYRTQEKVWSEQGDFLPLSVWASRGFCVENIVRDAQPADVRRNVPMLGDCYRVGIYSSGHRGAEGGRTSTNEVLRGNPTKSQLALGTKRARLKQEAAEQKTEFNGEDVQLSSDDFKSSSSSSSSSSKKKKKSKKSKGSKKKKKSKKERKAEAKGKAEAAEKRQLERAAKTAADKQSKLESAAPVLAAKYVPVVTGVISQLDALLGKSFNSAGVACNANICKF